MMMIVVVFDEMGETVNEYYITTPFVGMYCNKLAYDSLLTSRSSSRYNDIRKRPKGSRLSNVNVQNYT